DEQTLFAVGSQAGVGDEGDAQLGLAAEQLHDGNGELVEFREGLPGLVGGDKDDVEVGAVGEFAAAEFSKADDGERRFLEATLAKDDFERVLQASVGQ